MAKGSKSRGREQGSTPPRTKKKQNTKKAAEMKQTRLESVFNSSQTRRDQSVTDQSSLASASASASSAVPTSADAMSKFANNPFHELASDSEKEDELMLDAQKQEAGGKKKKGNLKKPPPSSRNRPTETKKAPTTGEDPSKDKEQEKPNLKEPPAEEHIEEDTKQPAVVETMTELDDAVLTEMMDNVEAVNGTPLPYNTQWTTDGIDESILHQDLYGPPSTPTVKFSPTVDQRPKLKDPPPNSQPAQLPQATSSTTQAKPPSALRNKNGAGRGATSVGAAGRGRGFPDARSRTPSQNTHASPTLPSGNKTIHVSVSISTTTTSYDSLIHTLSILDYDITLITI